MADHDLLTMDAQFPIDHVEEVGRRLSASTALVQAEILPEVELLNIRGLLSASMLHVDGAEQDQGYWASSCFNASARGAAYKSRIFALPMSSSPSQTRSGVWRAGSGCCSQKARWVRTTIR